MVATAAKAGPLSAVSAGAVSAKYWPKLPGEMISSTRVSSSPGFQKACATPRGLRTSSPGPASTTSSPICAPSRAGLADLVEALVSTRGASGREQRALLALALDFWTWRRLKREGLDDATARLMADAVQITGSVSQTVAPPLG